jgi:hypothetical protein
LSDAARTALAQGRHNLLVDIGNLIAELEKIFNPGGVTSRLSRLRQIEATE